MFIGIDANEANVKNRVGSNIYAFEILRQLYQQSTDIKFKIYLSARPLNDLPKQTPWWQYKVLKPVFLWTQWRLPLELYLTKEKPDVFFTPGHYTPRFCPMPSVISIMDLAFLKFPKSFKSKDFYQLVSWTGYSIKNAAHIFTISEHTKKDVMKFYKVPGERITVTYPGCDSSKQQAASNKQETIKNLKEKYKIKDNYLVYIGTLQPRKNLKRLVQAFLKLEICSLQLVIVGKKGWLYDEILKTVHRTDLCKKVIFTGYVSEKEKRVLLKNAKAFVLPSLYEGFGIPVVEAMTLGVPVVVSKVSSLPEIAGKAAIYIKNPMSVASITESLEKVLKLSESKRKKLIARGLKQAKRFSWEAAGKKTLEALKNVSRKTQ